MKVATVAEMKKNLGDQKQSKYLSGASRFCNLKFISQPLIALSLAISHDSRTQKSFNSQVRFKGDLFPTYLPFFWPSVIYGPSVTDGPNLIQVQHGLQGEAEKT